MIQKRKDIKNMKKNRLSIIALLFSLIAVAFAFFRITPFEITSDIYIGVVATFVAVSVTLVIGFQIINTLEIRKEIYEQRKMSEELKQLHIELNKTIETQQNEMEEGFAIINAFIQYQKGYTYCHSAFSFLHHALVASLNTNRTEFQEIFEWLKEFIAGIDWLNFECGVLVKRNNSITCDSPDNPHYQKEFKDIIKEYTNDIDEDEKKIRGNQNFCRISMEYDRIMILYRKRISEIIKDQYRKNME